ncbi:major facilitator superfamily domain-containing protein 8-like protein [Aphelenchoides avenae]|nr:major facilitator superfamily domain-containing protein 8-like protein [Aphelenchus avenae]
MTEPAVLSTVLGEFQTDWRSVYIITIVTVIGSVENTVVGPTLWPYMQQLDSGLDESFYGALNSIASVGRIVSSIASGYLINLLLNTKYTNSS